MDKVNWIKNEKTDPYYFSESDVLTAFFAYLWNTGAKEIYIHNSQWEESQDDKYLRVLDDTPDNLWDEFFEHASSEEYHRIARKEQKDGTTLLRLFESYPVFDQQQNPKISTLSPLYFLIQG